MIKRTLATAVALVALSTAVSAKEMTFGSTGLTADTASICSLTRAKNLNYNGFDVRVWRNGTVKVNGAKFTNICAKANQVRSASLTLSGGSATEITQVLGGEDKTDAHDYGPAVSEGPVGEVSVEATAQPGDTVEADGITAEVGPEGSGVEVGDTISVTGVSQGDLAPAPAPVGVGATDAGAVAPEPDYDQEG